MMIPLMNNLLWAVLIACVLVPIIFWIWYFNRKQFPTSAHDDIADALDALANLFNEQHTAREQWESVGEPFPDEVTSILGECRNSLVRIENARARRELRRACGRGKTLGCRQV